MSPDARNSLIAWGSVLAFTALMGVVAWSGLVEGIPDWLIWAGLPIALAIESFGMLRQHLRVRRGQA